MCCKKQNGADLDSTDGKQMPKTVLRTAHIAMNM